MSRGEATITTPSSCSSNAATCFSSASGASRSSPQTSFTSSPVASLVTRFQFRSAPPPAGVVSSRTRGSSVNCWSSSQVRSAELWSATTSSKSVKVWASTERIVSSM